MAFEDLVEACPRDGCVTARGLSEEITQGDECNVAGVYLRPEVEDVMTDQSIVANLGDEEVNSRWATRDKRVELRLKMRVVLGILHSAFGRHVPDERQVNRSTWSKRRV